MKDIFIKSIKKQFPIMIVITIVIIIQQYALTLPSKYLGLIVDELVRIKTESDGVVTEYLKRNILYVVLSATYVVFGIILWKFLVALSSRTFQKDFTDRLFKRFNSLKYSAIQNLKNGEIMTYLTTDANRTTHFLYRMESKFNRGLFSLIIVFFTMKSINLRLTLLVLIPIGITAIITFVLKNKVGYSSDVARTDFTKLSEFVQESTDAIRTTKAYSMEDAQIKSFKEKNSRLKKSNIKVDYSVSLMAVSIEVCFGICYAILMGYGGVLVSRNQISVGDIVAFSGYISLLYKPLKWFPSLISSYKTTQISICRIKQFCELPVEDLKIEENKSKLDTIENIEIKDLKFGYIEGNNVLENISLKMKKGDKIGIIGTIGAGKSSLANLLIRLYDVPSNSIFINGKDINDYNIVDLRKKICYITQDNFLFSTSISNNVSLFNDDYSDDEIEKSLDLAAFTSDLSNMHDGIQTIVGEKGIDLSGGQKQRVVLARAIVRNSDVLIFDDCFSALDNKTEEVVFDNINKLFNDKICIIISNRISEVKDSNEIIVLYQGKIIERGKHKKLINDNGLYNKFYYQQLSQERDDD